MKNRIVMAMALFLPLWAMADNGDDTLRAWLAQSDLVALGKIVSRVTIQPITKPGVMHYNCDFAVEDVLKGEPTLTNASCSSRKTVQITPPLGSLQTFGWAFSTRSLGSPAR